jgi:hypothetical protein
MSYYLVIFLNMQKLPLHCWGPNIFRPNSQKSARNLNLYDFCHSAKKLAAVSPFRIKHALVTVTDLRHWVRWVRWVRPVRPVRVLPPPPQQGSSTFNVIKIHSGDTFRHSISIKATSSEICRKSAAAQFKLKWQNYFDYCLQHNQAPHDDIRLLN